MNEALIVSAVRTPIGRSYTGSLANTTAVELGNITTAAAIENAGFEKEHIDDVMIGEVYEGGGCLARYIALDLGLPDDTPGVAINRHCASGMTAIEFGAASIMAGMKNVVLAGGITNCSLFPRVFPALSEKNAESPIWIPSHPPCPEAPHDNMVVTVGENTAKKYNISREDQDKWAFRSHQLAHECIRQGLYADEIVPVKRPGESPFMIDEQPQLFKSLDDLAKLDPIMGPGNTITMGNAAGLNDGASMVGMCSSSHAREHNIEPLAVIHGWATAGVEPKDTGGAPAIVVPKALEAASLSINDIDVFEINDPFAVLGVAFSRALDIDEAYINVHGSAVALGHPVACSGARMITTLIHALRKRGGGYGLAVICGAGGMASAVVVEVLKPS